MSDELRNIYAEMKAALYPEDVFGILSGSNDEQYEAAKKLHRQFARATHEDKYPEPMKKLAREAFDLAQKWWNQAEIKIKNGTYGNRLKPASASNTSPLTIQTKKRIYVGLEHFITGDICDLYRTIAVEGSTEQKVILKIVRSPEDNDFGENEMRILKHLRSDSRGEKLYDCLPEPIDSFRIADPISRRQQHVSAFVFHQGLVSLSDIIAAYPDGIDPRDMVWMWKRVLGIIGYVHALNVIHGALIPPHILFDLERHGAYICDWSYAVLDPAATKEKIKAISPGHELFYPPEILARKEPSPASDLFMVAQSMIRLLGGNIETGEMQAATPKAIQGLLKACCIAKAAQRIEDAWQIHQEIDGMLERLFGPRKFRHFVMPTTNVK